jgi:DNA-binding NarL/FixJ family response regulator
MLVDDSDTFRSLLKRVFDKNPEFTVISEAKSGKEALVELKNHNPDIILLDLSMPDMDGVTLLNKINNDTLGKIVIFSGVPKIDIEKTCLEAGASLYIEKGTSIEDIFISLIKVHNE